MSLCLTLKKSRVPRASPPWHHPITSSFRIESQPSHATLGANSLALKSGSCRWLGHIVGLEPGRFGSALRSSSSHVYNHYHPVHPKRALPTPVNMLPGAGIPSSLVSWMGWKGTISKIMRRSSSQGPARHAMPKHHEHERTSPNDPSTSSILRR